MPPAAPDALPERPGKDSGDVIQPAVTVEKGSGVPGITMAEKPMPVYQPVAEKPRPAAEPEKPTILPPPRTAAWEKIHSTDPVLRSGDKSDVPGSASIPETIPGTERISGPAAGDGPIPDPVEKERGGAETAAAREKDEKRRSENEEAGARLEKLRGDRLSLAEFGKDAFICALFVGRIVTLIGAESPASVGVFF